MKKVLFTLATLIAFGFAVNAQTGMDMGLQSNSSAFNAETNELTLAPSAAQSGRRALVNIRINDLTSSVLAFQLSVVVRDEAGEIIPVGGAVRLLPNANGSYLRVPGAANNPSKLPGDNFTENQTTNEYRIFGANTGKNVFWVAPSEVTNFFTDAELNGYYDEDEDINYDPTVVASMYTYPANVLTYQVEIDSTWTGKYATIEFMSGYTKFQMNNGTNYLATDLPNTTLKVVNADAGDEPLKDFAGTVSVTVNQETGAVTAVYNGTEEGATIDWNPKQLTEYGEATISYTVSGEGYNDLTGTATVNWIKPNAQFAGTAGATVAEDGTVTPYYTPAEGEEVPEDLNVTVNPSQLTEYGEQTVTVTVTGTGFDPKDFPVVVNYEAPQQQEVTVAPSDAKENVVVHENGVYYNAYTVSYTTVAPDTDADVYYRIGVWNEETETYDYPEDYTLYTGPFTVDDEGKYMVEAYAIAPNKEKSTFVYTGFEVTVIQDITALNELLGGKEVANVRYFNLAGQEMQEANGMTIVVTTYTDGTTSAVKVMK